MVDEKLVPGRSCPSFGGMRIRALAFVLACWAAIFGFFGCSRPRVPDIKEDLWQFTFDSSDAGIQGRWFDDAYDRSRWKEVHSGYWSDNGGADYDGVAWYASAFEIQDTTQGYSVVLGGVDDEADVWVNGKPVGSHSGYDEPFAFEASLVHAGRNTVVVRVVDRGGPGGLYKPVHVVRTTDVRKLLKSKFADQEARSSADWVRNAVVYEVYLRSFSKEGTFKGLQRRLPELKELGATVIWLMPIHPVGQLERKGRLGSPYSVQDYYGINPEFGTLDDFKSLVESVHRLGMKIIIDLVANHTAWDSKLIFEHPDWFKTNKEGLIVSPNADWSDVAQLDYRQHELRKYMINMMVYWVKDIGIDGFRCDVADMVPLDFWEDARLALDKIKPVMMLAEGKNPEDHLKAFDLTYAWNIYDVLKPVVDGKQTVNILENKLEQERLTYPKNSLRLRFNSNHDKNVQDGPAAKLYSVAGAKAAAVLTFALPGVPLIYNGDETGNTRKLDLMDKVDIDWSKGSDFPHLYTTLAQLRQEYPVLVNGDYERIWCSDSNRVFAFQRRDTAEFVNVVINFSGERKTVKMESDHSLRDLLDDRIYNPTKRKVELTLIPFGFTILTSSDRKGER